MYFTKQSVYHSGISNGPPYSAVAMTKNFNDSRRDSDLPNRAPPDTTAVASGPNDNSKNEEELSFWEWRKKEDEKKKRRSSSGDCGAD